MSEAPNPYESGRNQPPPRTDAYNLQFVPLVLMVFGLLLADYGILHFAGGHVGALVLRSFLAAAMFLVGRSGSTVFVASCAYLGASFATFMVSALDPVSMFVCQTTFLSCLAVGSYCGAQTKAILPSIVLAFCIVLVFVAGSWMVLGDGKSNFSYGIVSIGLSALGFVASHLRQHSWRAR